MPDKRPSLERRLSFAELDAIDMDAWAERLGLDDADDLAALEARIFADLLRGVRPPDTGEPVRVRQVRRDAPKPK